MRRFLAVFAALPLLGSGCTESVFPPAAADDGARPTVAVGYSQHSQPAPDEVAPDEVAPDEVAPDEVAPGEGAVAPAAALERPAPQAEPLDCPLDCTLYGPATCDLGRAPKVTVLITNQTDDFVYLVGSLDGSSCKWRYPHCYFEVTGPNGGSAVQGFCRCGNMNSLRVQDFVLVPSGGHFNPYQRVDNYGFFVSGQLNRQTFRAPGEYRLRFVYSTRCDDITQWAGDDRRRVAADPKLVALFGQVPRVEIRSNEIKVTIVEPAE